MAYKQRWAAYFDTLDADHDGVVTSADAALLAKTHAQIAGVPEGTPQFTALEENVSQSLQRFIDVADVNKNGKVTKEEVYGLAKKIIESGKDKAPEFWKESVNKAFESIDVNKNGEISQEEYVASVKKIKPNQSEESIRNAVDWIKKNSPTGKIDKEAFFNIAWTWATSENQTPEIDTCFPYNVTY